MLTLLKFKLIRIEQCIEDQAMHRRSSTHILHLAHVEPTASVCPLECNAPLRLELVHGTQFTTPHCHPLGNWSPRTYPEHSPCLRCPVEHEYGRTPNYERNREQIKNPQNRIETLTLTLDIGERNLPLTSRSSKSHRPS